MAPKNRAICSAAALIIMSATVALSGSGRDTKIQNRQKVMPTPICTPVAEQPEPVQATPTPIEIETWEMLETRGIKVMVAAAPMPDSAPMVTEELPDEEEPTPSVQPAAPVKHKKHHLDRGLEIAEITPSVPEKSKAEIVAELLAAIKETYSAEFPELDTERGELICSTALGHLGDIYTNDTEERFTEGADCSSLVYMSYKEAGIDLKYNHEITAASEAEKCVENGWVISFGYEEDLLAPGDLIFWTTDEPRHEGRYLDIYHAGIYLGDGQCVEASSSEGEVVVRDVWGKESIIITARPSADTE